MVLFVYTQSAMLNRLGILYTPGIRPTQPRPFGRGFFVGAVPVI